MVEVATIFLDYFRNWSLPAGGPHLEQLAYRINDLVEARGFKGRFAALFLVLLNAETGACHFCHAGDNLVHLFDAAQGQMVRKTLADAPAAGVFPSTLVETGAAFQQFPHLLNTGDSLLLYTDGVEEDKRHFRDANGQIISCDEPGLSEGQEHENHNFGEDSEELGNDRIYDVIFEVMRAGSYRLVRQHDPFLEEELVFDFSSCQGTVQEAVLAMASVDKMFRIYTDPKATPQDRIRVDRNIDEFMRDHFLQYSKYFRSPTPDEQFPEYLYFPNLKEDDQYDDLTVLGVRKL